MRQLGRFQHEGHEEVRKAHMRQSGRDRILASLAITLGGTYFPGRGEVAAQPEDFYARAKALGLYRP